MAPVAVRLPLGKPRPQRQHRLRPVERLHLCPLVNGEDDRLLGWVELEPDDVGDLLHQLRIVAELEGLAPVRQATPAWASGPNPRRAAPRVSRRPNRGDREVGEGQVGFVGELIGGVLRTRACGTRRTMSGRQAPFRGRFTARLTEIGGIT